MRNDRRRDEARGGRPERAEVGALVDRLRELSRRQKAPAPTQPSAGLAVERRMEILEERVAHLEAVIEGLQDAVDRQAVLQGEQINDLRRRTEPEEIARALSQDARRSGW